MLKSIIKLPLVCLALLCLFSTCTKEVEIIQTVEVEVPAPVFFQELSISEGPFKRYFNIQATKDFLLAQGENQITEIRDSNDIEWCVRFERDQHKEPIGKSIYANVSQGGIRYVPSETRATCVDQIRKTILMDSIDSDINTLYLSLPRYWQSYALVSGQYIFFPYAKENTPGVHMALIEIDTTLKGGTFTQLSVKNIQNYSLAITDFFSYTFDHWAAPDGFLFSIGSNDPSEHGTYKISFDGNIRKVMDRPALRMFTYQGNWYAMYPDLNEGIIEESLDNGNTWQRKYSFPEAFRASTTFLEIDGRLIGHFNDRLTLVEQFDDSGFRTVELNNREISSHTITSIGKIKDRAYIATLSGLFSRNWEALLEDKK